DGGGHHRLEPREARELQGPPPRGHRGGPAPQRDRQGDEVRPARAGGAVSDFPEGVALVVGASGGVGRAIALGLGRAGADLALTYRSQREAAEQLADELRALGRTVSVHALDLRDPEAARAVVAAAGGRVRTVAHAAGSAIDQPYFSQLDATALREVMDADVMGFVHVAQAALPGMRQGGGSFVYVRSEERRGGRA